VGRRHVDGDVTLIPASELGQGRGPVSEVLGRDVAMARNQVQLPSIRFRAGWGRERSLAGQPSRLTSEREMAAGTCPKDGVRLCSVITVGTVRRVCGPVGPSPMDASGDVILQVSSRVEAE
jgi:hypothetical protein